MKVYSNQNNLLQLLIFVSSFFPVLPVKRIVNGVDASENEFKFMVSLQRNGTHFCGGTILDENHILTAAHCVCDVNWDVYSLLKIKLTPLKLTDPNATLISVSDVICNKYDVLELIRDVAIINLSQKIPASLCQPIKLPEYSFSTALPLHGIMIGWGLTSTTGTISNVLQKVDVVVYNDDMCTQSYSGVRNVDHQICSGWPQNGRGSCQGDSGGPLLVENIQIGVISFGDDSDCGISDMERPKISARVSAYLDWIYDVIKSDKNTTQEQATTEGSAIDATAETNTEVVDTETTAINEEEGEDQNLPTSTEYVRSNHNNSNKPIFLKSMYILTILQMYYKICYN